jgi:hypothetical protein
MLHKRVFNTVKTRKLEWISGSQQRTLGHIARGRVLMLGLETHSGEAFGCVNVHKTGYGDSARRVIIWENLSRTIRDSNLQRIIISGDMNAANPGERDAYSQNPVTARQRQAADSALLDFAKNTGGTLVSPPVPTWRRGDGTQSATLDHVILINFQDSKVTTVAEALGDIQHDHLCLESKTWSHIKSQVDLKTAAFNTDIEGEIMEGRMGARTYWKQTRTLPGC